MEQVVYLGPAHVRELGEADFAKMGVEHHAVSFEKNVPYELSNKAGAALLGHPLVAGEFMAFQEVAIPAETGEVASYQGDQDLAAGVKLDEDDDDDESDPPPKAPPKGRKPTS